MVVNKLPSQLTLNPRKKKKNNKSDIRNQLYCVRPPLQHSKYTVEFRKLCGAPSAVGVKLDGNPPLRITIAGPCRLLNDARHDFFILFRAPRYVVIQPLPFAMV